MVCCVFVHADVTDDVGAAIAYRAPGTLLKLLALATILSAGLIAAPAISDAADGANELSDPWRH